MSIKLHSIPRGTLWAMLFAVVIGSLFTVSRFQFGTSDHVEQLPIVMRAANGEYLQNDAFVNASVDYGPRFYYAHFMAFLSSALPMPRLYFVLTLLTNCLLALVTLFTTLHLFHQSTLSGILAVAIVMSVETFALGWLATIPVGQLLPSSLVMPLLFSAILLMLKGTLIISIVLTCLSALIHPLLGLELGSLLLVVHGAAHTWQEGWGYWRIRQVWMHFGISLAILSITAFVLIQPYWMGERLPTEEFINIIAYLRHPHHYIPSSFAPRDYLYGLGFLIATFIAWIYWRENYSSQPKYALLLFGLVILLLCLGGYVFVEIIPSQLWTTAQTWRLLYFVKWLGLILIAGTISHFLSRTKENVFGFLLLGSMLSPIALAGALSFKAIKDYYGSRLTFSVVLFDTGPTIFITLSLIWLTAAGQDVGLLYFSFLSIAFSFFLVQQKNYLLLSISSIIVLAFAVYLVKPTLIDFLTNPDQSYVDIPAEELEIAKFAFENTTDESLFIVPPFWGHFRFTAKRAIFVDFKSFPFQDAAIKAWLERLFAVYGEVESGQIAAWPQLVERHAELDDEHLMKLHAEYQIEYAILYAETQSSLPIVFKTDNFKIVNLSLE